MSNTKVALVILDGWGKVDNPEISAIANAQTPTMDKLYQQYPDAELVTFGGQVGLPEGQIGNSEVGHMNIGAGRVVYQSLARINKALKDQEVGTNPVFEQMLCHAQEGNKRLHLMGLVSDGGVHSSLEHLKGICDLLKSHDDIEVFIHAFTDGRDTSPQGGKSYLAELEDHIAGTNARVVSIIGRFYAMDRDNRWERIKRAYDLLTLGTGTHYTDSTAAILDNYNKEIYDEFVEPSIIGAPELIEDGDTVFFINFRTDRPRELTQVLTQTDMPEHDMRKLDLHYVTMTEYASHFEGLHIMFENNELKNTLGEVLAAAGKTQLRIAETEKYPHVTFFFNGGAEEPYPGEDRIVIPSPKVKTYDLKPEMSANEVTVAAINHIKEKQPDFICLNYANTDMVGHTGDMQAATLSAEAVDTCLGQLIEVAVANDYTLLVIADHGNADIMVNEDGSPNTAHTLSMVPVILVNGGELTIQDGKLGDIAPTILHLMGTAIPDDMDGIVLVS